MVTWVLFLGIGLIIGIVAGLYFARLDDFSNRQKNALQQKLDAAESQLKTYQSQVTEHFLKTASLVNSMTESYQAVHEHLASGATELCDRQVIVEQLEMPATKLLDNAVNAERASQQHPAKDGDTQAAHAPESKHAAEPVAQKAPETPETEKQPAQSVSETAQAQPVAASEKSTVKTPDAKQSAETVPSTQKATVSEEQAEERQSVEAIQPPSTPESLHVHESESGTAKSSKETEQTTPANVSRMVH